MKTKLITAIAAIGLAWGCNNSNNNSQPVLGDEEQVKTDPVVYSFVFVGCNRVQYGDQKDTTNSDPSKNATNRSSANLAALSRIYKEIAAEKHTRPVLFSR